MGNTPKKYTDNLSHNILYPQGTNNTLLHPINIQQQRLLPK